MWTFRERFEETDVRVAKINGLSSDDLKRKTLHLFANGRFNDICRCVASLQVPLSITSLTCTLIHVTLRKHSTDNILHIIPHLFIKFTNFIFLKLQSNTFKLYIYVYH